MIELTAIYENIVGNAGVILGWSFVDLTPLNQNSAEAEVRRFAPLIRGADNDETFAFRAMCGIPVFISW